MTTDAKPQAPPGLPVQQMAASAQPGWWHQAPPPPAARQLGQAWIVTDVGAVTAALAAPSLVVVPPHRPAGPAADILVRMARFSNGSQHTRRRALVSGLLPPLASADRITSDRVNRRLRRRALEFDAMPLARTVPAEVLGIAMGLPPAQAERAATLTGRLCDAVSGLQPPPVPDRADDAAAELCALMSGLVADNTETEGNVRVEATAAAVSILFQARDAAAALIGLSLAAGSGRLPADQPVDQVLRENAPVQCTRRRTTAATAVGDTLIPAGADVWIFVAAAEQGSVIPATFGCGPHACPAAAHAIAISRRFLLGLAAQGWRATPGQDVVLEDRPNIRCPRRVLVSRT